MLYIHVFSRFRNNILGNMIKTIIEWKHLRKTESSFDKHRDEDEGAIFILRELEVNVLAYEYSAKIVEVSATEKR